MKKLTLLSIFVFSAISVCGATQITVPVVWSNGDTVTNTKLNNVNNTFANAINGGLDNTNMASGYRLINSVSSLPAAGNQGNVDFLTSDNSLNIDNGATWLKTLTPQDTLATGQIPYYNSGWHQLAPGTTSYPLVSNGTSSLPSYQVLPIAGGGTGQVTQQAAIDALLPSQTSNSGKFLTTNGTTSSWGSVTAVMTLVSNTAISAASNSGDIAISATKYYMVVVNTGSPSGSDSYTLRLNNDNGSTYNWVYRGFKTDATSSNGTSTADSTLHTSVGFNGPFSAVFYILPQDSNKIVYIKGSAWGSGATGFYWDFFGTWNNSATVTSFRFLTIGGATFTGNVLLYEIKQS